MKFKETKGLARHHRESTSAGTRRSRSPITGKKYPKCSEPDCKNNVYAAGKCYGHQQ